MAAGILLVASQPQSADAGVLYRYSRLRSLVHSQTPRAKTWRCRKSTAFLSRNPIRAASLGTTEDDLKIGKAEFKYQQKLYRWELRKKRAEQRIARKRQRLEEAEQKKLAKQQAAMKKKMAREQTGKGDEKQLAPGGEKTGTGNYISSLFGKDKTSQKVELTREKEQKPKLSFWAKLRKALIGH